MRVALADGTLVPTLDKPSDDMVPSLLSASDVLGTGWFAADAANVRPGSTVVVVGDGAVGLLGVLTAKQMGAGRIIAKSRHETRQKLAREFGATDIVTQRGDQGVARIKDRAAVYRHAHAYHLFEKRRRNVRAALEKIIERAADVEVTASAVVQAITAYSKINAQGQWVDQTLSLNELFERMTTEELTAYAATGALPAWFSEIVGATAAQSETGDNDGK